MDEYQKKKYYDALWALAIIGAIAGVVVLILALAGDSA